MNDRYWGRSYWASGLFFFVFGLRVTGLFDVVILAEL